MDTMAATMKELNIVGVLDDEVMAGKWKGKDDWTPGP